MIHCSNAISPSPTPASSGRGIGILGDRPTNSSFCSGAIKLCAFDDATAELNEIILTSDVLQSVRIPGQYWHGFKVLGEQRAYLVYFVNKLYNYAAPDEERRPWNDPTVCPALINGSAQDQRCGQPWDWQYTSFK